MGARDKKLKNFYAGGFLYNPKTNSVLLHLRDDKTPIHPNQWAFFGGLSEKGESPENCFIREIKEELNIQIRKEQLLPLCDYLNTDRGTWRYVFYVESDLAKKEMELAEGADFDWIPLAKVFDYNLTKKTRNDLQTFISGFRNLK